MGKPFDMTIADIDDDRIRVRSVDGNGGATDVGVHIEIVKAAHGEVVLDKKQALRVAHAIIGWVATE